MTIIIVFGLLILLAALGMPVAFALGVVGVLGLWLTLGFGPALGIIASTPFRQTASLILTTIPMFILMAEIANQSKITEKLFSLAQALIGHIRGGLGIATIVAASLMGAMSGSSSASTATFAATAAPAMEKRGYNLKLAMGIVSSAGTIAIMIPPSLAFILYGVVTQTSIGMLFLAGIIPGILTAVIYAITVLILVGKDQEQIKKLQKMHEATRIPLSQKIKMLGSLAPVLIVAFVVVGGIYSGAMTATEAGGVGAFAMLVVALFQKGFNFKGFNVALDSTIRTTAMVMTIIVSAFFFAYFITTSGVAASMVSWVGELPVSPHVILIVLLLIYILLGCFMEQTAVLIVTLPLAFPLIDDLGFNAIWFGVLITKTVEMGMITPPFGMNCFIAAGVRNVPSDTVFRGTFPFIIAELITLALLIAFPEIVTFIPDYVNSLR